MAWTYDLLLTGEQTQTFMGMGEPSTLTYSARSPLRYQVLRVSGDTVVLREQTDSIAISFSESMGAFRIDTVVTAPLGIVFHHTISRSGKLLGSTQESVDSSLLRAVGTGFIGGGFGLGGRRLALWLLSFPEQSVPIGHQWTSEQRDTTQQDKQQTVRYLQVTHTVETVLDTAGYRCARIRSRIDTLAFASSFQTQYGSGTVQGSGSGNAVTYVDLGTGLPLFYRGQMEMEMTMSMSGQIELAGTIEQTLLTELRRR
jgi:hypothetical protein